jgi:dolichol-phosphate mannosyltransferase
MIGVRKARKPAAKQAGASRRFLAKHVRRLGRFCVVGASGVLVNTALLYVLTEAGGLNHLVSATLATEAAILSNFALNDNWTFRDARGNSSWLRRAVHYNFVSLGGLLISVAMLAALTYLLGIYYLFANFFAIGSATLWNYAVNHHWTWPATRRLVEKAAAITSIQTSEPTDKRKVD